MINSIESLPLKTYQEILKTGNLKLLGEGTDAELLKAWDKISAEYFNAFGISSDAQQKILLEIEYINHMRDFYATNDAIHKTYGKLVKARIEMMSTSEKNEVNFIEACVNLSISLQTNVDFYRVTVSEFFYYMKASEARTKAIKSSTIKSSLNK